MDCRKRACLAQGRVGKVGDLISVCLCEKHYVALHRNRQALDLIAACEAYTIVLGTYVSASRGSTEDTLDGVCLILDRAQAARAALLDWIEAWERDPK